VRLVKLFRTREATVVADGGHAVVVDEDWDALFNRRDLRGHLERALRHGRGTGAFDPERADLLPPIGGQEVWAAGVTYVRSRSARVEESKDAGGGDFYERVYDAPRPEIFFKATPHRVVGHRQSVRVRRDSKWSVPEPELALAINAAGEIFGYTICNDMTSRDIEGENPLYLPQAKTFDGCAALGPGLLITSQPLPPTTAIHLKISRAGAEVFAGDTTLEQLRRTPASLVEFLFREASFPQGCFLFTGTGIVPPDDFTLAAGDQIRIEITGIGALVNSVG
jgi:2-dehydro-3-deoxy-D-arabinonate dehydratase